MMSGSLVDSMRLAVLTVSPQNTGRHCKRAPSQGHVAADYDGAAIITGAASPSDAIKEVGVA